MKTVNRFDFIKYLETEIRLTLDAYNGPDNITISDFTVTDNLELKAYDIKLTFKNCHFLKSVEINQIASKYYIAFKDCYVKHELFIGYSTFEAPLTISNLTTSDLRIANNVFKNNVSIDGLSIDSFTLSDLTINQGQLSINETNKIKNIHLDFGKESNADILISNLALDKISLTGINSKTMIKVDKVELANLHIVSLVNNEVLQFNNITTIKESSLIITGSSLAKTYFHNIDFSAFKAVSIIDSSISEIIANAVVWPKFIYTENKNEFYKLRETYRQLKYATAKQGDIVSSLKFKQLEMDTYLKSLKGKGEYGDKFILYTNRIFNNHGLSWIRAFVWIIAINSLFFSLIQNQIDSEISISKEDIYRTISDYLQFINPIHKSFFESNSEVCYFIETISRIVNSYLIFQFLRAFRKYAN